MTPEIKKWIEDEAYNDLRIHKYEDLDGVWIAGATSLYQHLSEQIEKQKKDFDVLVGNDYRQEQEIERLKGLIEKEFKSRREAALFNAHITEINWQTFKTENNL